ncbi:MAG: NAD(P)-binding domain-containing protein [Corynebacterium nuruki]|nr:NAD(P)-binding domain-containing protein [Corynebacterium nuruki]
MDHDTGHGDRTPVRLVVLEPTGVPDTVLRDVLATLPDRVEVTCHDRRPRDDAELVGWARDAEILIVAALPLRAEVLAQCPVLRHIAVAFVGVDHVDVGHCRARGITVNNCPGYSDQSVAELVVLLILALSRSLPAADAAVRSGGGRAGLRAAGLPSAELSGKTVGIIGAGRIGRRTAELVRAFGARTVAWNRTPRQVDGLEFLPLDEVMATADIVSVHLRYTPETTGFIDERLLGLMSPGALFINTARGQVVDNAALARALTAGRLAGAGIDVFDHEPPLPADDPLLAAPHTVFTPHTGYATDEALARRIRETVDAVRAFLAGAPVNLV